MNHRGFTLIELLIVVIIVGILASVAIPTYISTVERARGREAIATLQAIIAAERTYSSERRTPLTPAADADWLALGMENPDTTEWNYTFAPNTATATRTGGPGGFITLDMNGNLDDSNFAP